MDVTTKRCGFCGKSPTNSLVFNTTRHTDASASTHTEWETIEVCLYHEVFLAELPMGSRELIKICREALKSQGDPVKTAPQDSSESK